VVEDLADHRRIEQKRDNPHLTAAFGAGERIDPVDAADQLSPRAPKSAPRLATHEGQKPRLWHEKATRNSARHSVHLTRANPQSKMPQSRNA